MTSEREAFEKWCAYYGHDKHQWDGELDEYSDQTTNFMWRAWQAARQDWQPISEFWNTEYKINGEPVILADFDAQCLLSGAPHVWTARWAEPDSWVDADGNPMPIEDERGMWLECSYAATNENGAPTHFMPLPPPPKGG